MQSVLETAFGKLLGEAVSVAGAGRTDAGVHATGQVISFRTRSPLPERTLERGVNALLPADVAVHGVTEAPESFHARFSATGRTYNYTVWNGESRRPLLARTSLWVPQPLDVGAMRQASRHLTGRHDFGAFSMRTVGRSRVRTLRRAGWSATGGLLVFEIEGDGFLRGMVRGIVGTLLRVGRAKLDEAGFAEVLASGDRRRGGPAVAPRGLCLVQITFGADAGTAEEDEE